jgi:large subunit ribosomal protein L11
MLRKAAGIEKGISEFREGSVGSISKQQLREIAESKLADLNAGGVEEAMAIIAGTARSMGIDVGE